MKTKPTCFIICPIGADNSPTRRRVDQWTSLIYEPAFEDKFLILRADKIAAPGIITEQILDQIVNSELAIIDYTELNPNVMYEAAIRHIARKPFIQVRPRLQQLPFDISTLRTISYDPEDLEYPQKLVTNIKKAYEAILDPSYRIPELLPYKFDLEKIVSDPNKFVEILKKHFSLVPSTQNRLLEHQVIEKVVETPFNDLNRSLLAGLGITTKQIKCPKCGILQTVTDSPYTDITTLGYPYHYKCSNCGTEFKDV